MSNNFDHLRAQIEKAHAQLFGRHHPESFSQAERKPRPLPTLTTCPHCGQRCPWVPAGTIRLCLCKSCDRAWVLAP